MIKINRISEFYMIFAQKIPKFYVVIARKIFFPNFVGHMPPDPPSPTPMGAGDWAVSDIIVSKLSAQSPTMQGS